MKRNYMPVNRMIGNAGIAARNAYVDGLCKRFESMAIKAVRDAAARQSASEGAAVLVDEARSALLDLLRDPDAAAAVDAASRDLDARLAASIEKRLAQAKSGIDEAWISRRGRDLARAAVGFIIDLGDDDVERYIAGCNLLLDFKSRRLSADLEDYRTIHTRFGLDVREAYQLFMGLHTGVLAEVLVRKSKSSESSAVYAGLWRTVAKGLDSVRGVVIDHPVPVGLSMQSLPKTLRSQYNVTLINGVCEFNQRQIRAIGGARTIMRRERFIALQGPIVSAIVSADACIAAPGKPRLSTQAISTALFQKFPQVR